MSAGVNTLMASLLSALRASALSMPYSNSIPSKGRLLGGCCGMCDAVSQWDYVIIDELPRTHIVGGSCSSSRNHSHFQHWQRALHQQ
jgi:hypothetical protein